MNQFPEKLQKMLELLDSFSDRNERMDFLVSLAEKHTQPPPEIAELPYPEDCKVGQCESEAYVFSSPGGVGTLDFHIAIMNPQGMASMAMAVILQTTLSGAPLSEIMAMPTDFANRAFGGELSFWKNVGLSGMVDKVKRAAEEALNT